MNQTALFRPQVAALTRYVDQLPQFNFTVNCRMMQRGFEPQQSPQEGAGPVKDPERRAKNPGEHFQRLGHHQGQAFASFQGEHFWH